MKIIHNKFIPFGDFDLINILGLVFSKTPESNISKRSKRHEGTHTYQQYELLTIASIVSLILCNFYASWWYLALIPVIPFVIYATSFLIELFIPPYYNAKDFFAGKCFYDKVKSIIPWIRKVWLDAYYDNCFEREAYMNDGDPMYNSTRPWVAWVKYIIPRRERKG